MYRLLLRYKKSISTRGLCRLIIQAKCIPTVMLLAFYFLNHLVKHNTDYQSNMTS